MNKTKCFVVDQIRNSKYGINTDQCKMIRKQRNSIGLSAEKVSVKMGVARCWLARLERGEFQSIKGSKLLKLFRIIFNKNDILDETIDFLSLN